MGACRYSSDGGEGGRVLGYVTSDLVEERNGRLRLSYYNGDTCANGRKSAVHVYFQCAPGEGAVSQYIRFGYPNWKVYILEVTPVYFSKLILSPVLEFPTKFSAQPINSYLHQRIKSLI